MSTPAHYPEGVYEPIKVIEAWGLGFSLGNVLKYIARADHKGDRLSDLRKALNYLQREAVMEAVACGYTVEGRTEDQHDSQCRRFALSDIGCDCASRAPLPVPAKRRVKRK